MSTAKIMKNIQYTLYEEISASTHFSCRTISKSTINLVLTFSSDTQYSECTYDIYLRVCITRFLIENYIGNIISS